MSHLNQTTAFSSSKVDALRPGLISLQAAVSDVNAEQCSGHLSAELQSLSEQLSTVLLQLQMVATGSSALESCSSLDSSQVAPVTTPALSGTSSCQLTDTQLPDTPHVNTACSTQLTVNVSSLLDLLASSDPAVQAAAAGSLRSCSLSSHCCSDIAGNGGIMPLVNLLNTSSSIEVKESIIGTLCNLATSDPSTHTAIADAGGIKAAVHLLGTSHSAEAHYQAAVLLHALASSSPAHITGMAAAGAIPPLLQLLSSNIAAVQAAAVGVVNKLASQPSSCAVLAASGGCQPLIALLDCSSTMGSSGFLEELLATISNLSQQPVSHADIVSAGGIPLLAALLEGGTCSARASAAEALKPLAALADGHALIIEAGGVSPLVQMLCSDAPALSTQSAEDEVAKAAAAAALAQLAVQPAGRSAIAAAGGIPYLVQLLSESTSPAVQEAAVQVLQNLAVDPNLCSDIIAAGSVQPLVQLLSAGRASNSSLPAAIAGCLGNLAWDQSGCSAIAETAGGIPILVQLLGSAEESVVAASAAAVAKLAWEPELCSDIADAGGINALVPLLASSSEQVLQPVAAALQNMTYDSPRLRKATCCAGAIPLMINLLDCSSEAIQKHAAAALHNLALEPSNCHTIAAAGGVERLSRLMDSGNNAVQAAAGSAIGKLALEPAVRLMVAECRRQS